MWSWYCGVLLFSLRTLVLCDELELVQVLFRHGVRTPVLIDPNSQHLWDELGYPAGGTLVRAGELQMQDLGKFLHSRYIDDEKFLSFPLEVGAVRARSTDVDRTLMSAQAVLKSLFPDTLVPIHTVELEEDKLLYHWCPSYAASNTINFRLLNDELLAQHGDLIENLYRITGWRSAGIELEPHELVFYTADNLVCQEALGLPIIDAYLREYFEQIKELQTLRFMRQYSLQEPFDPRGPNGAFLGRKLVANMEARSESAQPLIYIYAAHETSLISLYSALGLMFEEPIFLNPPAGNAVIIELWKRTDGTKYVTALNGQHFAENGYVFAPMELMCPERSEICEMTNFSEFLLYRNPPFDEGCCYVGEGFFESGCDDFLNPEVLDIYACLTFRRFCPQQSCGIGQILNSHDLQCQQCELCE